MATLAACDGGLIRSPPGIAPPSCAPPILNPPPPPLQVKPSKGDRTKAKDMAHVLIKYHVPGALHREFVDTWQGVQKGTAKEKGNRVYGAWAGAAATLRLNSCPMIATASLPCAVLPAGLRKSWSDNEAFYTYGTWDTLQDWVDHLKVGAPPHRTTGCKGECRGWCWGQG